jgi:site-specific DNA recombinase
MSAYRNRDRSDWIGIPVPVIVDNEMFELAQELFKRNIKLSLRNTREGSLLQGLISCKECGYCFKKMVSGNKAKSYHYYCCSRRDEKCSNRGIRMQSLDEAVWRSLTSTLESPELIKKEISRRVSELKNEPHQLKQRQLEKKIVGLETESNRLLDAFQAGHIEMEDLSIRMNVLKRDINNTKREAIETSAGLSKEQLLGLAEAVEYFSKHLKKTQNNLVLEEKRKIVRMLVKEIQIGKDGIEINHIIPIRDNLASNQIACLCAGRGVLCGC